jgi:phage baseplate assembly protein W
MNNRTAPFLGRGAAFPLRLNSGGGLLITDGTMDEPSVAVQYLPDGYTLQDQAFGAGNHIAESIAHILQVIPGERDTLPEFGSYILNLIFDPNNFFTRKEFEIWTEVSTDKWERRARIPDVGGVVWNTTDQDIDDNKAVPVVKAEIILAQKNGNLVFPFVTARDVRNEHYPFGGGDEQGHDWLSRYRGSLVFRADTSEVYIRNRVALNIETSNSDSWYETIYGDTWYLVSYKNYGDIRLSWIIADTYAQDCCSSSQILSRDFCLDPTAELVQGTILRIPDRVRVLMEIV